MKKTKKETKEELNTWRDIHFLWLGRLNIVKTSVLSNLMYKLNQNPSYVVDIDQLSLMFI